MSRPPRPAVITPRKRACIIKATTLQEILETCDRHLKNISKTQLDLIDNEDGTPTDDFYIGMWRGAWQDLREDVVAMIKASGPADTSPPKAQASIPPEVQTHVHVVEMTESESGWGQRPDGFQAFLTEKAARDYITEQTKDYKGPAPSIYVRYDYIGIKEASIGFVNSLRASQSGHKYFDRVGELKNSFPV